MSERRIAKPAAVALGAALTGSIAIVATVEAGVNPFSATTLRAGYMLAAGNENDVGDKDTEGSCGGDKDAEGSCGGEKDAEGSCGGKKDAEGSCAGDKDSEGKCGEGNCGGMV